LDFAILNTQKIKRATMKNKIVIGNATDLGNVRRTNQDYYGTYTGQFGTIILVCDGMGGHAGGEVASQIAVQSIESDFEVLTHSSDPRFELSHALINAHNKILAYASTHPELHEMGTTVVTLFIKNNEAFVAHAGDSRAYLFRGDNVLRLTKDHSLVQEMIDADMITSEEAKSHPQKNVVTKVLGAARKDIEPEVSNAMPIFKNDMFMLCTDGLTTHIEDDEMQTVVRNHSPQKSCDVLIRMAKDRGGLDNITVQIVEVKIGKRLH
jgi:PPM family protein phosphatase